MQKSKLQYRANPYSATRNTFKGKTEGPIKKRPKRKTFGESMVL